VINSSITCALMVVLIGNAEEVIVQILQECDLFVLVFRLLQLELKIRLRLKTSIIDHHITSRPFVFAVCHRTRLQRVPLWRLRSVSPEVSVLGGGCGKVTPDGVVTFPKMEIVWKHISWIFIAVQYQIWLFLFLLRLTRPLLFQSKTLTAVSNLRCTNQ